MKMDSMKSKNKEMKSSPSLNRPTPDVSASVNIKKRDNHTSQYQKICFVVIIALAVRALIWLCCEIGIAGISPQSVSSSYDRSWLTKEVTLALQTPVSSYDSLQEASMLIKLQKNSLHSHFMHNSSSRSLSPYLNDIVRTPPLLLYLLSSLGCLDSRFRQFLFLMIAEFITAGFLGLTVRKLQTRSSRFDLTVRVRRKSEVTKESVILKTQNQSPENGNESPTSSQEWVIDHLSELAEPWIIVAIHLLNPISILTIFSLSVDPLRLLFFAAILAASLPSQSFKAIFPTSLSLALLAYLLPLPNVIGLGVASAHAITVGRKSMRKKRSDQFDVFSPLILKEWVVDYLLLSIVPLLVTTFAWFFVLHWMSYLLMGRSWDYWDSCVTSILTVRDLTPNLGIFWYIFQLMFSRVRHLFISAFQTLGLMLSLPLCFKFIRQPLGLMQIMSAVILLFQPHPTAMDLAFIIVVLCFDITVIRIFKELTALVRWGTIHPLGVVIPWVTIICFTLTLFPVMGNLWLRRNSGNPNFLYTAQLGFTITCAFLILRFAKRSIELHSGDRGLIDYAIKNSAKEMGNKID